jgi:hypothetical protein
VCYGKCSILRRFDVALTRGLSSGLPSTLPHCVSDSISHYPYISLYPPLRSPSLPPTISLSLSLSSSIRLSRAEWRDREPYSSSTRPLHLQVHHCPCSLPPTHPDGGFYFLSVLPFTHLLSLLLPHLYLSHLLSLFSDGAREQAFIERSIRELIDSSKQQAEDMR